MEAGLFLPDKGSSTEPCPGILGAVLKGIIFTFETRSNSVAQDDPNLHPQSPKHWGGRHANRTCQTRETVFNFSILSTNQVVPTQTSPLSFVETISKVSQGTNDWHKEPEALGDSHLHQEEKLQQ